MRESHAELQIPTGRQDVPYGDQRTLVNGVFRHQTEMFIGKVTGAGGVGGALTGVPFEPAYIKCLNEAGANPAVYDSVFASDAAIHTETILAVAINANPPVVTRVGAGNFTIALPTEMAPNTEVVTVLVFGARDLAGSL